MISICPIGITLIYSATGIVGLTSLNNCPDNAMIPAYTIGE
jgi:hypothetical protein